MRRAFADPRQALGHLALDAGKFLQFGDVHVLQAFDLHTGSHCIGSRSPAIPCKAGGHARHDRRRRHAATSQIVYSSRPTTGPLESFLRDS
jgi:hypothetical protein